MERDYHLTMATCDHTYIFTVGYMFKNNNITISITEEKENYFIGNYTYESEARFGSSEKSEGIFLVDKKSSLIGLTTIKDRPKPDTIIRDLNKSPAFEFKAPKILPENQHKLFDKYNGHGIKFCEDQSTYELGGGIYRTIDPEDRAKDIAMSEPYKQISDDLIEEVIADLIDNNLYIKRMDFSLSDDLIISYGEPISFYSISKEYINNNGWDEFLHMSRNLVA